LVPGLMGFVLGGRDIPLPFGPGGSSMISQPPTPDLRAAAGDILI
jgi:hypothetical protein